MNWTTVLALSIPASVALIGYLTTYFNNLLLAQRRDRLDRVNAQLSGFYGPLLALRSAEEATWQAFRKNHRLHLPPDPWADFLTTNSDSDEAKKWRLWITEVFMPLNIRMMEIITTNTHLIEEPEMPQCLLDLCAHVEGYRPIVKQWANNDFTYNKPVVLFPDEVDEYIRRSFRDLKADQALLLGLLRRGFLRRRPSGSPTRHPRSPNL